MECWPQRPGTGSWPRSQQPGASSWPWTQNPAWRGGQKVGHALCVEPGFVLALRQVPEEGSEIVHARFVLKGLD